MNYLAACFILFAAATHLLVWLGDQPLFQLPLIWSWAFLPPCVYWLVDNLFAQRAQGRFFRFWEGIRSYLRGAIVAWMLFLFGWWEYRLLFSGQGEAMAPALSSWKPVALGGLIWFISFLALTFADERLKRRPDPRQQALYNLFNACLWLLAAVTATLLLGRFNGEYQGLISRILAQLTMLPALEIICRLLRKILPRKPQAKPPRPLFELYLFDLLAHPRQALASCRTSMGQQLGVAAAGEPFFQTCLAALLPMLALSVLILWLLTSVVILDPGYQAVVLRFGNPTDRTLTEGISLKAPWPIDTIRDMNVDLVRRIRVGSHQPTSDETDIYRTGTPILWTNDHGVTADELLIVAAPRDLMSLTAGAEKTPSISLVGADITIEYRIKNLRDYLTAGKNVQDHVYQLSMQLASKSLFQYDVDAFFCQGRIELPRLLHQAIQVACDSHRLGIEILQVGLGGVHPPQNVAQDFQSTVAALQHKTTLEEAARQESIQNLAQVSGTVEQTRRLLAQPDAFGRLSGQAEGQIAQLLAQARSYRCEKVNIERGKAERFRQERLLYEAAPTVYLNHRMMSALEKGLKDSPKYMIIGDRDKMVLRFNHGTQP